MIGGGAGPATGSNAATGTPARWNLEQMPSAAEAWPMHFGFVGNGNAADTRPLGEQWEAGAMPACRDPRGRVNAPGSHRRSGTRASGPGAGLDRELGR